MEPTSQREPSARDMMSAPAATCRPDTALEAIAEMLADREISGLPVVSVDGRVLGLVTERDLGAALGSPLVRLAMAPVRTGSFLRLVRDRRGRTATAADIMSAPAIVVSPEVPLRDLARLMVDAGINRLPVVDAGRLLGVVSRGDLLRAIARLPALPVPDYLRKLAGDRAGTGASPTSRSHSTSRGTRFCPWAAQAGPEALEADGVLEHERGRARCQLFPRP